jgi:hypothetical protein
MLIGGDDCQAVGNGDGGFVAFRGALIQSEGATTSSNNRIGFKADGDGRLRLSEGATASNNAAFGFEATGGGVLHASDADLGAAETNRTPNTISTDDGSLIRAF